MVWTITLCAFFLWAPSDANAYSSRADDSPFAPHLGHTARRNLGVIWPCAQPDSPEPPTTGDATARALMAPQQIARRQRAHQRACALIEALGADANAVWVFWRQRAECSHFGIVHNDRAYFGKARAKTDDASAWLEPQLTERAAQRGFAPTVWPTPDHPDVLLTQWFSRGPFGQLEKLGWSQKLALLDVLRRVHQSEPARPADPTEPQRPVGASWAHLQALEHTDRHAELDWRDVRARLHWIDLQRKDCLASRVFVHGDAAQSNAVWHDGQIWLIDWESAGWGDAMADLARLISSAQWPNTDLPRYLAAYLQQPATDAQLRRLALLVAAFDIDHYGNARLRQLWGAGQPTRVWRDRIVEGLKPLPDLPPVRLRD